MNSTKAEDYASRFQDDVFDWLREQDAKAGVTPSPSYKLEGVAHGGSAVIFKITKTFKANEELYACLKLIRGKIADDVEQHVKFVREAYLLLRTSANGYVLPVLNGALTRDGGAQRERKIEGIKSFLEFLKTYPTKDLSSDSQHRKTFSETIREKVAEYDIDDYLVVLEDVRHEDRVHVGFLTQVGYPIENLLTYALQQATPQPVESAEPPKWLKTAIGLIDLDDADNVWKEIVSKKLLNVDWILERLIVDTLSALKDIHDNGLVHLDVKEANIIAVLVEPGWAAGASGQVETKEQEPTEQHIRFVLFDFGSAVEQEEIDKDEGRFESTYQYLPAILQRRRQLSQFTSFKRVEYDWSDVFQLGLKPEMLDVHALSQVITNVLVGSEFSQLSGFLDGREFEEAFAFAQLMSVDFKEEDEDSVFRRGVEPQQHDVNLPESALSIYRKSQEISQLAIADWKQWKETHGEGARPAIPETVNIDEGEEPSSGKPHPVTHLYDLEKRLLTEDETIVELYNQCQGLTGQELREKANEVFTRLSALKVDFRKERLKFNFLGKRLDFTSFLEVELIKRMGRIRQLALVHLNPPVKSRWYAQHCRLDHSIGTLEIVRIFLLALLNNSAWFRLRFRFSDGVFLLLLGLLHDLGHYPCAHSLEDTKIFPHHERITEAMIKGEIDKLGLHSPYDDRDLREKEWPHDEDEATYVPLDDKIWAHDMNSSYPMRCCTAEDLIELHKTIETFLDNSGLTRKDFKSWYGLLIKASSGNLPVGRLIFRVLASVASGPIDADKLHYLANDSIHCGLSLATVLEGRDFVNLFEYLRVPIRHLEGSPTQRYCLGVQEDSGHLPQLVMFLRAAMYGEVYWSRQARASTVMLRSIILEGIRLIFKYTEVTRLDRDHELVELLGSWIRGDDQNAHQICFDLAELVKKRLESHRGQMEDEDEIRLDTLVELLLNSGGEEAYNEVCRIYPSDTVAYQYIRSCLEEVTVERTGRRGVHPVQIGGKVLEGPSSGLMKRIREIVAQVLRLRQEDLSPGSILVDIPAQETTKREEFTKFAVVDQQGFGRPIGLIWDAIERYFAEHIRLIRIFIRSDVVKLDQEMCIAVRSALLANFS